MGYYNTIYNVMWDGMNIENCILNFTVTDIQYTIIHYTFIGIRYIFKQ